MKFKDFKLIQEKKDFDSAKCDFWMDDLGDFKLDIGDGEEVLDYIKRRSKELNNHYCGKTDGLDVNGFTVEDVIDKLGWALISLEGKKDMNVLKNRSSNSEKPLPFVVYKKAVIKHPRIHDSSKDKDKNIDDIVRKIWDNYGTVEEIISIDRNGEVKHFISKPKEKKKKWKNPNKKGTGLL